MILFRAFPLCLTKTKKEAHLVRTGIKIEAFVFTNPERIQTGNVSKGGAGTSAFQYYRAACSRKYVWKNHA
jgi:hypothetical protein